ncbi:Y-family DNA polymerase [uncultured Photobacterium sp.]|uniref:Y-family DNA polymerase n=1 Tax=uncultured Photobacterium sp. TaxID=173973 RepID=UPI0026180544|nr:Y-family DNA polymerase [uncultured Photobacterium sp.]
MSLYALFDGTRFYASAAEVYQPELRGRPIVVTGGKDGMIIAANRKATDLGIKKFSPVFEFRGIIELKQVAVVEANFNLFGALSNSMHSVIEAELPKSYRYSVDEIFADITGICDPLQFMADLRKKVFKETRLPIGAAASHNCTLAKAASWCAKKVPGYNGLCLLESDRDIDKILTMMPASELWGVGSRIAARLNYMGINTAIQLKHADHKKMKHEFGKPIVSLIRELHGERVLSWREGPEPKRQIYSTRSIRERLHSPADLQQALAYHVHEVCEKARKQKSKVKKIQFFCSSSPYDSEQHRASVCASLDYASNHTAVFLELLTSAMPRLVPNGKFIPLYKIGVGAIDLSDCRFDQGDLFAPAEDNRLMSALDNLNQRFGRHTLYLASQGNNMLGERVESAQLKNPLSRWSEIPIIHC